MRARLAGIVVAAALRFGAAHAEAPWVPVETVPVTWGATAVTLVVEKSADENADDPVRLRIVSPGGRALVITPEGGLATLKESLVPPGLTADNRIASHYGYMSPKLHGPNGTPGLVVFGHAFASSPGALTVVALDAAGLPRIAFKADNLRLDRIAATAKGQAGPQAGADMLVGARAMGEQTGSCTTYNPIAVFRFAPGLAAVEYDATLSRRATLAGGGVWAGPDASPSVLVLHPANSQARVVAERACH